MVFEQFIRSAGLAVGFMVFEQFIRSAGLAVGLKPSATECEARWRGRERSMYAKTMSCSYLFAPGVTHAPGSAGKLPALPAAHGLTQDVFAL